MSDINFRLIGKQHADIERKTYMNFEIKISH